MCYNEIELQYIEVKKKYFFTKNFIVPKTNLPKVCIQYVRIGLRIFEIMYIHDTDWYTYSWHLFIFETLIKYS